MNNDTRMDRGERVTRLDGLTRTDLGPILVLFCLFIAGLIFFAGGMILLVLNWRLALALFLLVPIVGVLFEVCYKRLVLKSHRRGSIREASNKTEKWIIILRFWIPQKHREAIMGDILEDCYQMRESGLAERRIRANVLWQLMISVVMWIPSSVIGVIGRLLGTK